MHRRSNKMQTNLITTTCTIESGTYTCTTPAYFSQGEMFISFILLIGLILALLAFLKNAIFSVPVHREYLGVNQQEGKEIYKI